MDNVQWRTVVGTSGTAGLGLGYKLGGPCAPQFLPTCTDAAGHLYMNPAFAAAAGGLFALFGSHLLLHGYHLLRRLIERRRG